VVWCLSAPACKLDVCNCEVILPTETTKDVPETFASHLLLLPLPVCIMLCGKFTSVTLPLVTRNSRRCSAGLLTNGILTWTATTSETCVERKSCKGNVRFSLLAAFSWKKMVNSVPTASTAPQKTKKKALTASYPLSGHTCQNLFSVFSLKLYK